MKTIHVDFAVVGSGLAGLVSALRLAEQGRVLVLTKKDPTDTNTSYAQGGVACVVSADDSFELHVADTLDAGAGLCREDVVRSIVSDGPARIRDLEKLGVTFEARGDSSSGYDLGKEGGHSRRRILHCGDMTGRELQRVLLQAALRHPNITVRPHAMVIDLITTGWLAARGVQGAGLAGGNRCVGAYVQDSRSGEIFAVQAPYTVLATGGGGKVYLYTTNPDVATADGVAIAWRAGLPIRNLEFIQFHPTSLYHPDAKSFLISEAVRGEKAILVNAKGESFTEKFDSRGSLAPRDIVARAVDSEMKSSGAPCVYLDIRHKSKEFLESRFPNIYSTCLRYGIDMAKDLIPVVPSAHFFCGGIEAGVDGVTAMPGLLACGETACTGLHGANRLASNSLLEALVCSHRMAETVRTLPPPGSFATMAIPPWHYGRAVHSDEAVVVEHNWNEVRTCMWDYVGIVRTNKRLERATHRLANLRAEIREYYLEYLVTADILELRNIADVAHLIIRSASLRHESRGLHFTLDYPETDDARCHRDTIIMDPPRGGLTGNTP